MNTTTNATISSAPTPSATWSKYKIAGAVALAVAAVALAILIAVAFFPNVAFIASAILFVGGSSMPLFLSTLIFSVSVVAAPIFFVKHRLANVADERPMNLDDVVLSSEESEYSDEAEEEEEAQNFCGAGVLPYHIDEEGEVYVAIGKEASGTCKGHWSDFGGDPKTGETPLQTAAREAKEESRGLLGRAKDIRREVKATPFTNKAVPQFLYYTYLLKVDDPTPINKQALLSKKVTQAERLEKSDIQWVKINDLFCAVMNPTTITRANGKNSRVTKMMINGKEEIIRSSFAVSLHQWLKHDQDRLGAIFGVQDSPATS